MGWFMPENRHFMLFSAVGYNAKEFLTLSALKKRFLDLHVCINFKPEYLKN
jgi:hypothetical protein